MTPEEIQQARQPARAIKYKLMQERFPKQKARLTRAMNDREHRVEKVVAECKRVVKEWDECGAWPDDWSR